MPRIHAVEDKVDARDVVSRNIALLCVKKKAVRVLMMTAQVFSALEQERGRAAGPIADFVLLRRLNNFRHEVRNCLRRVELAGTLARFTGEGADEVFVGVAKE